MPRHYYGQDPPRGGEPQFHVVQLCRSHPVPSHQMTGRHTATARHSADQAGHPPSRAEHSHRETEGGQHTNEHASPQRLTLSNQNRPRQANIDPTPATGLPRPTPTARPACPMPVGHHHPNGPTRASTYTAMYHTYICVFEILKPHTQYPPHTRTRSALTVPHTRTRSALTVHLNARCSRFVYFEYAIKGSFTQTYPCRAPAVLYTPLQVVPAWQHSLRTAGLWLEA